MIVGPDDCALLLCQYHHRIDTVPVVTTDNCACSWNMECAIVSFESIVAKKKATIDTRIHGIQSNDKRAVVPTCVIRSTCAADFYVILCSTVALGLPE